MKVLARAYKENLILGVPMAVISSVLFVFIGIILFDSAAAMIALSCVFFLIALGCLIYFIVLVIRQIMTKAEVVLYDEINTWFTVNCYRQANIIRIDEIIRVEYRNKGLLSFSFIIFSNEFSYGKIIFFLKSGKKIVTPNIENVTEAYEVIKNEINIISGGGSHE